MCEPILAAVLILPAPSAVSAARTHVEARSGALRGAAAGRGLASYGGGDTLGRPGGIAPRRAVCVQVRPNAGLGGGCEVKRLESIAAAAGLTLALGVSSAALAQTPPAQSTVQSEGVAFAGTSVRGGRAITEVNAPFDVVARMIADFTTYREFMPRVEESRVVQRRRGQQDVYFRAPLLDDLGVVWVLERFDVRRTPSSIVIDGHMVQGNLQRMDLHIEASEVPGTRRTRVTLTALAIPGFPLPGSVLATQHTRWTGRALISLRDHAERLAGIASISPSHPGRAMPPHATGARPPNGGGPVAPRRD